MSSFLKLWLATGASNTASAGWMFVDWWMATTRFGLIILEVAHHFPDVINLEELVDLVAAVRQTA